MKKTIVIIVVLLVLVGVFVYFPQNKSDESACCEALTAECLACSEGVTVEKYCETHQDVIECSDVGVIVETAQSYEIGDTLKVLVTNNTSETLRFLDGPSGCTIHFERMVGGDWVRVYDASSYDNSKAPCVEKEMGVSENVEFSRPIDLNPELGTYRVSFITFTTDTTAHFSDTFEIR